MKIIKKCVQCGGKYNISSRVGVLDNLIKRGEYYRLRYSKCSKCSNITDEEEFMELCKQTRNNSSK